MAFSAHKDEESIKERYDSPAVLDKKIDQLVEMIRKSKHFVIFTGAGISTDAGIPDFRGPEGVWTLKAQGRYRTGPTTDSLCAIPTATHMSMVQLQNRGILHYVISQNCDGLHRRSGIRPEKISELHGNGNIEVCEKCGHEYLRDYDIDRVQRGSHWTGRRCVLPNCRGKLMDSTIDFGQNLPVRPLKRATKKSNKSDLHLVLGSSLTVRPACTMPKKTAKRGGNLVIVNLQKTPLDRLATLRIFHRCDVVMKEVMKRLAIPIPPFLLKRHFAIRHSIDDNNKWALDIRGVDYGTDGSEIPASTVKGVDVIADKKYKLRDEPFKVVANLPKKGQAVIRLYMFGHYAEPPLDLTISPKDEPHLTFCMTYNPSNGEWAKFVEEQPEEREKEKETGKGKEKEKEKEKETDDMEITQEMPQVKIRVIQTSGRAPNVGLWGAAAIAKGPSKVPVLVSCGGSDTKKSRSAISVFNFGTSHWSTSRREDSDVPYVSKRRWGNTATVVKSAPSQVYMIGGWDATSQFNDVNILDCKTGEVRKVKVPKDAVAPIHRAGHSATAYGKNIILFGGARCERGPYVFFNDVFAFNVEMETWRELKCTGDVPCPRSQHAATLIGDRLIVVGGFSGDALLNDVYELNLSSLEWKCLETHGNPPEAKKGIQEANFRVHPARPSLNLLKSPKDDQAFLAYLGASGVYLLSLDNWTWEKVDTMDSPLPSSLVCHTAVDVNNKSLYIFGGLSNNNTINTNEIFCLELE